MPDFLISFLAQCPVVGLVGFVAWYLYRKQEARGEKDRTYEREQHDKALERAEEKNEQLVKAKDKEIAHLKKVLLEKVQELNDAVKELKGKGKQP